MPGGFMRTIPHSTVEYIKEREKSEAEVKLLIEKKDYDNAFVLLAINPQLKGYLSHEELRTMYDFTEKTLKEIYDITLKSLGKLVKGYNRDVEKIKTKLKGLEGKTE
jgi:hypothetical protein